MCCYSDRQRKTVGKKESRILCLSRDRKEIFRCKKNNCHNFNLSDTGFSELQKYGG